MGSASSGGRQSKACRTKGGSSKASGVWEEEGEPGKGKRNLQAEAE